MGDQTGLWFTLEAAEYVLEFMRKNAKSGPVRIVFEKTVGCGDAKVAYRYGAKVEDGDTESVQHGLHIVVNYIEFPTFDGATVDLDIKDKFTRKLVYRFPKMSSCGCGEAYTQTTQDKGK